MKNGVIKRMLIIAISVLVVALSVVPGFAATHIVDGDWKYEITDSLHNEYYIAQYLGDSKIVEIPSLFQTKPVTKISREAFHENATVTKVSIPKTVNEIGQNAFFGATSLAEITIPSSVTTIGVNAFYGCTALKKVVFEDDSSLKTIPNSCFSACTSIESATISYGIEQIASKAFRGCTALSEITIAPTVTTIAADAFKNCSALTIYGWNDTYAQQFAADNNITFVSLGDYIKPTVPATKPTQPTTTVTEPVVSTATEEPSSVAVTTTGTTDVTEPISSTAPATTDATEPSKKYLIGDSNLDGRISVKDATLIQKYAALLVQLDHIQLFLGNCDGTGDVNVKDATQIQKYCAGFLNILFVGQEVEINGAV